jgi:hypothetical protein
MARIRIEDHRIVLAPGADPVIELVVGGAVAGRCRFHAQAAPDRRATRDFETGFVELHYDVGDYERVRDLLRGNRVVWVGEDLALEA